MDKSPVYTTSKTQRQKNVKQRDCQVSGCPFFIRFYSELSAAAPDLEKQGDPRLLTGGPPSFYAQQALKSKSEGTKGKSRGLLLTTATTGKPCFVCGFLARWWRRPSPLVKPAP